MQVDPNFQNYQDIGLVRPPDPEQTSNELGQSDFLTLMVAQLRNQDPSKPMDSGDFLGQLAQFGSVAGLDKLNTNFEALAYSMFNTQTLDAATLVGKEVLVPSDHLSFDGENPSSGAVFVPDGAQSISVIVRGENGEELKRIDIESGTSGRVDFEWDGLDSQGNVMESGSYQVEVQATLPSGRESLPVAVRGRVDSVAVGAIGEPIRITLNGLGSFFFDDILEIG
ncbi:MAG: flagellar hook assembly protein FlgD [bacterium]